MGYTFLDWIVLIILIPFNLGFISVIIGVPAIIIWALYLKLAGKVHEPSGNLGILAPPGKPIYDSGKEM